jgi:hypothetical protein
MDLPVSAPVQCLSHIRRSLSTALRVVEQALRTVDHAPRGCGRRHWTECARCDRAADPIGLCDLTPHRPHAFHDRSLDVHFPALRNPSDDARDDGGNGLPDDGPIGGPEKNGHTRMICVNHGTETNRCGWTFRVRFDQTCYEANVQYLQAAAVHTPYIAHIPADRLLVAARCSTAPRV